ncbi:MAG: hypothetical protein Kow0080_27540 [Candidatus Promineifilaceae bacterium]
MMHNVTAMIMMNTRRDLVMGCMGCLLDMCVNVMCDACKVIETDMGYQVIGN